MFKVGFLENEVSREKMLFHVFDLLLFFFYTENHATVPLVPHFAGTFGNLKLEAIVTVVEHFLLGDKITLASWCVSPESNVARRM